jgi:hypothetical protein
MHYDDHIFFVDIVVFSIYNDIYIFVIVLVILNFNT